VNMPEDSETEAAGPPTLSSTGLSSTGLSSTGLSSTALSSGSLAAAGPSSGALHPGVLSSSRDAQLLLMDDDILEDVEDDEEVLEVEPEPLDEADAPPNGFHAFLRHANLHNLVQIESLSRTTGVFLVVSGGARGYLHLADGELVHAETGRSSGEAAATEILSWEDGEFKSCARPLAPVRTVHASVQSLLMRLAQASDEAAQGARRQPSAARVVRRPLDQEAPTQTHLPPAGPPSRPATAVAGSASRSATERSGAEPPLAELPAAAPPAPLPGRAERQVGSVADVLLSAAGEIIQGRGLASEEFAARVAYAARLAELIGRAIRSGTPRALELRGKRTQTLVQWQTEGNLSASLDSPQPSRR
jgi:Domain of unknown function (DUF4388)